MMIYSQVGPTYIYEFKALIYVQEEKMDMYHQELTTPSATTNIANAMNNTLSSKNGTGHSNVQHQKGHGRGFRGKCRGRKMNGSRIRPTCQL